MAGVGESTLRTYFKDPEFVSRYREAFGDLVRDATRQAQQAMAPALETLREISEDKQELSKVRVQAARSMLEFSLKLSEHLDILERLEALENNKEVDNET